MTFKDRKERDAYLRDFDWATPDSDDIEKLLSVATELADKCDELEDENENLKEKIEKLEE